MFGFRVKNWETIRRSRKIKGSLGMPRQLNIVDLFNRKLFPFVDFDFVLKYMVAQHWATCEWLYTAETLASLVADRTRKALVDRQPANVAGMYAVMLKLCSRRSRNLLVYFDPMRNKLRVVKKLEVFFETAGLYDNVFIDDMFFPTERVLPGVFSRRVQTVESPRSQAISITKAAPPMSIAPVAPSARAATEPSVNVPRPTIAQEHTAGEPLVLPEAKSQTQPGLQKTSTGLFDDESDPYELFRVSYDVAIHCEDASAVQDGLVWDTLVMYTLADQADIKKAAAQGARELVDALIDRLTQAGASFVGESLRSSSGPYAAFLRKIYNFSDGLGQSNSVWLGAALRIYSEVYKVPLNGLDQEQLRQPVVLMRHFLQEAIEQHRMRVATLADSQVKSESANTEEEPTLDSLFG